MEVTIYRCSSKNYWYQNRIGEVFEVEDSYPDVTRYKIVGEEKTIDLEDTLEFIEYDDLIKGRDADSIKSEDVYKEIREFLQEHNAPPLLKQKLYIMYVNASFFD